MKSQKQIPKVPTQKKVNQQQAALSNQKQALNKPKNNNQIINKIEKHDEEQVKPKQPRSKSAFTQLSPQYKIHVEQKPLKQNQIIFAKKPTVKTPTESSRKVDKKSVQPRAESPNKGAVKENLKLLQQKQAEIRSKFKPEKKLEIKVEQKMQQKFSKPKSPNVYPIFERTESEILKAEIQRLTDQITYLSNDNKELKQLNNELVNENIKIKQQLVESNILLQKKLEQKPVEQNKIDLLEALQKEIRSDSIKKLDRQDSQNAILESELNSELIEEKDKNGNKRKRFAEYKIDEAQEIIDAIFNNQDE
ncbi:Hypothetical_protein [Hexamita inflata]|uniref:Hypothetical_protein n=1 Tax=Hexamita inflata TaxID=28002 RepID=A0AA86PQ25_9EUKA|nr:Hypothetical protein HINF_LOCUS26692 [Hexamita inflata]